MSDYEDYEIYEVINTEDLSKVETKAEVVPSSQPSVKVAPSSQPGLKVAPSIKTESEAITTILVTTPPINLSTPPVTL
jgi:hypothetical protein